MAARTEAWDVTFFHMKFFVKSSHLEQTVWGLVISVTNLWAAAGSLCLGRWVGELVDGVNSIQFFPLLVIMRSLSERSVMIQFFQNVSCGLECTGRIMPEAILYLDLCVIHVCSVFCAFAALTANAKNFDSFFIAAEELVSVLNLGSHWHCLTLDTSPWNWQTLFTMTYNAHSMFPLSR